MVLMYVGSLALADAAPDEAGCKAKDVTACVALGDARAEARDVKAARAAYEKACKLGSPEGCGLAGQIAIAVREEAEAIELFEAGCAANDIVSCAGRARVCLQAHEPEAAMTWGSKGCVSEADLAACADNASCSTSAPQACRAVYAAAGELRRFDVAYTAALTACRLGDRQMCQIAYDTPNTSVDQRMTVLKQGCEDGRDPAMCHAYGTQLTVGDLVAKDEAGGEVYILRACDAGHVDACTSLAEHKMSDPRTKAEALPFLEKACTAGSSGSCSRAKALRSSTE